MAIPKPNNIADSNKALSKGARRAWCTSVFLLGLQASPMFAAEWELDVGATVKGTYTDNLTLATSGAARSDFITDISPFFTAKKNGARLKVDLRYAMQNLVYARDDRFNGSFHQLNARANAELVDEAVFIDVSSLISQAAISPLGAANVDNANATGNVSSIRSFTLSPYWIHRFGADATLNARYSVSTINNSSAVLSDSINSALNVMLNSGSSFGRIRWSLNASDQKNDYQNRSDVSFTKLFGTLSYRVSPRFGLGGAIGHERHDYALAAGTKTAGAFWRTGMSWSPSNRTTFELGYGGHYYGNTWALNFRTKGQYSVWSANYEETVTTSNAETSNAVSASFLSVPDNQQPVLASGTLAQNTQTNQVFLQKRFATAFMWKKGKSEILLSGFHSRQTTRIDEGTQTQFTSATTNLLTTDIFQVTDSIKQIGLNGEWRWRMTPLMSGKLAMALNRSSYGTLGREDVTRNYQLGVDRQFSPRLTGNVTLRHQIRDSNQDFDYRENALSGSLSYKF